MAKKTTVKKASSMSDEKVEMTSGLSWTEVVLVKIPNYNPFQNSEGFYFDHKAAQKAIDFFQHPKRGCIRHVKGEKAGQLFKLELWQMAIVANLFGWRSITDGTRRYRNCFIYIPRKNGKSIICAAIALYLLYCDGEPGAEIYCAAADATQSAIVFDMAKGMLGQDDALATHGHAYRRSIVVGTSYIKAITSEASTKHGYNAHGNIIDEVHAHPTRELIEVLVTSTGARKQPINVFITTADYDRPSICNEYYTYACKVRDNALATPDPRFLPVIYELTREDDWEVEANWYKANPNLGVSVSLEYLRQEYKRAKDVPTYENTFRRLHMNQRTQQDVRWMPMALWDHPHCAEPFSDEFLERLKGRQCFGGLDLAAVSDTCAFALFFPEFNAVLLKFWVPKLSAELREKNDRIPYWTWMNQKFITGTEGNTTDYDVIRAEINALRRMYKIIDVGVDRWNANQLINQLTADRIEMVPFGQGYASMSAPTKELERLVKDQDFRHGGNPVLRWMASNVTAVIDDAGNIKLSKGKSGDKIDGMIAVIMAIGRSMMNPVKRQSLMGQRGLIIL